MRNFEIPQNTLLHDFNVYNAIVVSSDGIPVAWNNTLGFKLADNNDMQTLPPVDISDMPNVLAAVDKFVLSSNIQLGSMPYEQAKEIVSAMLDCGFFDAGLSDENKRPEWPSQYSLEELVIANRIVANHPGEVNEDGSTTKMMNIADRGIAARYALAHWGGPEALLNSLGYTLQSDDEEDD